MVEEETCLKRIPFIVPMRMPLKIAKHHYIRAVISAANIQLYHSDFIRFNYNFQQPMRTIRSFSKVDEGEDHSPFSKFGSKSSVARCAGANCRGISWISQLLFDPICTVPSRKILERDEKVEDVQKYSSKNGGEEDAPFIRVQFQSKSILVFCER